MRNDPKRGKGHRSSSSSSSSSNSNKNFIPTPLRTFIRGATSVAANLRTSGSHSLSHPDTSSSCDQVQWAGFDKLEIGKNVFHRVLLLGYLNGFQVWDVEEADDVRELVSKQDGPVSFLQIQPRPNTFDNAEDRLSADRPLLIVVTGDSIHSGGAFGPGLVGARRASQSGSSNFLPSILKFYSLRSHKCICEERFQSAIYTVRCSPRIVAVALCTQIYCYDPVSLQNMFSVLTYPVPQASQPSGSNNIGYGPMAVGTRWLAYAANHVIENVGRASPQHLTPSPSSGVCPSMSPANGNLVTHAKAGLATLGDMGYNLTKYWLNLLPDGSNSPKAKNSSRSSRVHGYDTEAAGMVIVRDFLGKMVVSQFKAQNSPISALCFDPSGTLLVTASVRGHNLNVYRIMPISGGNPSGQDNSSFIHLYKLHRGITDAVIQDISFSDDSHWIVISTPKGTSHLFAISPFGGPIGLHTHEGTLADATRTSSQIAGPKPCWWSESRSLMFNQQSSLPSNTTTPISLSVVSRIKNGNAGWRGTVSDAAAAATGRCSSSGAISAVFHSAKSHKASGNHNSSFSKNQLWVFFPSGHLVQYSLRLCNEIEGIYSNSTLPRMSSDSSELSIDQDFKVTVEILQKWDVFQVLNRAEREDDIVGLCKPEASSSNVGGRHCFGGSRNGVTSHNFINRDIAGNEGNKAEEKHHWLLSKAEVQMHQTRTPIWTKSEMYFHVMVTDQMGNKSLCGNMEIERIPSRLIEVRMQDLVPVFDDHSKAGENYLKRTFSHGGVADSNGVNSNTVKDEWMEGLYSETNVGILDHNISLTRKSSTILNGRPLPFKESQQCLGAICHTNQAASHELNSMPKTTERLQMPIELQENSTCQESELLSQRSLGNSAWNTIGSGSIQFEGDSDERHCRSKFSANDSEKMFVSKHVLGPIDNSFDILNGDANSIGKQNPYCGESSISSGSVALNFGKECRSGTLVSHLEIKNALVEKVKDGTLDTRVGNFKEAFSKGDDKEAENVNSKYSDTANTEKTDDDGWDGSMFPSCTEGMLLILIFLLTVLL